MFFKLPLSGMHAQSQKIGNLKVIAARKPINLD